VCDGDANCPDMPADKNPYYLDPETGIPYGDWGFNNQHRLSDY